MKSRKSSAALTRVVAKLTGRIASLEAENKTLRTENQELQMAWDMQRAITKQYSDQLEAERAALHRGVRRFMTDVVCKASPRLAEILKKRIPQER